MGFKRGFAARETPLYSAETYKNIKKHRLLLVRGWEGLIKMHFYYPPNALLLLIVRFFRVFSTIPHYNTLKPRRRSRLIHNK
jgi:hypothetical protein